MFRVKSIKRCKPIVSGCSWKDLIIKNNIIENVGELNSIINDDINQLTNSISTLSLNEVKIESDDDIETNQNDNTKRNNCSNPNKTSGILPKINTKVIYHNPDTNSWNEVLVLGKAGKIKNIKLPSKCCLFKDWGLEKY